MVASVLNAIDEVSGLLWRLVVFVALVPTVKFGIEWQWDVTVPWWVAVAAAIVVMAAGWVVLVLVLS
jgi:hypothetical protein